MRSVSFSILTIQKIITGFQFVDIEAVRPLITLIMNASTFIYKKIQIHFHQNVHPNSTTLHGTLASPPPMTIIIMLLLFFFFLLSIVGEGMGGKYQIVLFNCLKQHL